MDRNREARRASIGGSDGFNRRKRRTNSLRDSPEKDGALELQESVRLRDRVKKDGDRDQEMDRERHSRGRDLRDKSNRSKKRRAEKLTNNKDDIRGDETSEESADAAAVRFSSPAMSSISEHHNQNHHVNVSNHHHSHVSSFTQQHNSISTNTIVGSNNHHLERRKTFPRSSSSAAISSVRAPPPFCDFGDEMISLSVPRKARSACKRSHDWTTSYSNNNSGGGGDQNPAQPSNSQKHSVNNKTGAKLKPPKASSSSKPRSSNPEELEIEIAEVLYGLMTQSQGPSSPLNLLNNDAKPCSSYPVSNSNSNKTSIPEPNSNPLSAVAPKRKRQRQLPETLSIPVSEKEDTYQTPRCEISSLNEEKVSGSASESGCELIKPDLEIKPVHENIPETRDLTLKENVSLSKELESPVVIAQDFNSRDSQSIVIASSATAAVNTNLMVPEIGNKKEEKFEIDLIATLPLVRSSHIRESKVDLTTSVVDHKPVLSILDADLKPVVESRGNEAVKRKLGSGNSSSNVAGEEKKCEESDLNKGIENKGININLHLDLEKHERDGSFSYNANENILKLPTQKQKQPQVPLKASKEEYSPDKSGHATSSLLLPMSMASWPGGLPPMGYMTPIQGVVSTEGGSITPAHIQRHFSQPRPRRCDMHCHIARNIQCLQQLMKMNTFWQPPAGTPESLFGSKPDNSNVVPPADLDMSASIPSDGGKAKSAQPATSFDSAPKKQHHILFQQALPSVAPSNLLGPTFIFPSNCQPQAAMTGARLGPVRPPTISTASSNTTSTPPLTTSSFAPTPMRFHYPDMSPEETQYLAVLQNNGYPFPIPTVGVPPPKYIGPPAQAMPLYNGSFYSSEIIQQLQNANASINSSSSQKKHVQSQQEQTPPQSNNSSQKAQQSHGNQHNMHSSEDSPSEADNRGSRASMSIYGQNFLLPINCPNLDMVTPCLAPNSNKKEKQSHLIQDLKSGVDPLPPHIFATLGGIDVSSMAKNHAAFQNCSEAVRLNIQMMAVSAQAAQKNFQISEGKLCVESLSKEDERNNFAFPRLDPVAPVTSSVQANAVIESSARSLTAAGLGPTNVVPNAQVQAHLQQQQMLQLKYQQQQHMVANAVNRNKVPTTSDASVYSERLNSAQTMGPSPKFQSISYFPQNLVQSNNPSPSPSQSPQWKSSTKTSPASQGPSSLGPSTVTMQKNLLQHPRTQHTQISFGNQIQQSPTTSSVSKGTSGSPRTTSFASTISKVGHASSFSALTPNKGLSTPTQKSTSTPHAAKASVQQQSQPKTMQQQLFFSNPYNTQSQSPRSTSTSSTNTVRGGYYTQQMRPDQHHRGTGGPPLTSSSGVLTLVSMSNTSTNDPATAIAAAT